MPEDESAVESGQVSYPYWRRLFRLRLRTLLAHPGFRRAPLTSLCRFLAWRVRLSLQLPVTVELPRWHGRLFLPADWGSVGTTMIYCLREQYEPELLAMERFIRPGQVIVDAGASCGIYTVAFAKLLEGTGQVLAFEPGARAFAVLLHNIGLNDLVNARAFRMALADRPGAAPLYHHPFGPVSYSLASPRSRTRGSEEVATGTLDEILDRERLGRVDLLKMDVEGAEELVLRGAEATMSRSRPVVLFEHGRQIPARAGLSPSGVLDVLGERGYHFYRVDRSGNLGRIEGRSPLPGNIVGIPD